MSFLATFYLLVGLVTYAKGLAPPETFYDVLVKSCPILNVPDAPFKNQAILQKCNWTWQEIIEIKALTEVSKQKVLCLLYYDAFISFCTEISTKKIPNVTINLVPDLKDYSIDKVCNGLAIFPPKKTFAHNLITMISNEHICNRLCLNFDGTLVNECCVAHYFANYDVSSLIPAAVPNVPQLQSNPDKMISAVKISNTSEDLMISQKKDAKEINNNSPKVNQAENIDTIVQQDSGKSEQELKKNSKLTAENTLENNNAPDQALPKKEDSPVAANSNSVVGDQSPTNTNKNEPQIKGKSAVVDKPQTEDGTLEEPQTKDEAQGKDETQTKDEPQTNDDPQSQKQSQKQSPAENISEQNAANPENEMSEDDKAGQDIDFNNPQEVGDDEDHNFEGEDGANDKVADDKAVDDNAGEKEKRKPSTLAGGMPANYNTAEDLDGESYFFSYFMVICVLFVLGYVGYHNRQKVMALMLEGKRGKRQTRGRRPNSANYHKLDSNLEEAISSTCTKNSSHVIY